MILSATVRRWALAATLRTRRPSPFTNLLEQLVRTDLRAGEFDGRLVESHIATRRRSAKELSPLTMRSEQFLNLCRKVSIAATSGVEIFRQLVRRIPVELASQNNARMSGFASSIGKAPAWWSERQCSICAEMRQESWVFRQSPPTGALLWRGGQVLIPQFAMQPIRANAQLRSAVRLGIRSATAASPSGNPAKNRVSPARHNPGTASRNCRAHH